MKMDNNTSLSERIESLDRATLTPIVQRATHCPGILTHWTAAPIRITYGGISPSFIYRFSGGIEVSGKEQPWSLVLKASSPTLKTKGLVLIEANDFSREYEFYRSDLAQGFPPGFRAAFSYAQSEVINPDGQPEYWIWLEDMERYHTNQWGLDEIYQAALGLGKFNGAYLSHTPLPEAPWLKRNQIRKHLQVAEPAFQRLFARPAIPAIQILFPPEVIDSLEQLWQDRERHLSLLERLPQTLCHGDAQFSNLFLVPSSGEAFETVAIDWSAVGIGPLGLDPAQFFMMRISLEEQTAAQAMETALFQGYLDGVRAAGWLGDPRLVRLGFTFAMLKVRATHVLRITENISEDGLPTGMLKKWLQNQSLEEWAESTAWVQPYTRKLFEESLELRAQLFDG
jgi:hypothetical protein